MRIYRSVGITILALLPVVSGCNQKSALPAASPVAEAPAAQAPVPVTGNPIRITLGHDKHPDGYAGHPYQVGDTLTWTVLDESPGMSYSYQLSFPTNNPVCDVPPKKVVTVAPGQPFSCQAIAPTKGKAGGYTIVPISPVAPVNRPNPGPSPAGGATEFSAIPCRVCS